MKKRIVITGVNGFVGHHLAQKLSANNIDVIGVGRDESVAPELTDIVTEYHAANLIEQWPEISNVDAIIHLAGLAAVGPSFDNPQLYINANSAMVTNMCEFYTKQEKKPRIISVSSGAIYGPHQELPITENSAIGLSSPYAVSKVLTENQCQYYSARGLECVVVRPFNHIGPGQGKGFILPDFFNRLSEADTSATIRVGNINSKRDYTDVRDIVDAYSRIALAPKLAHSLYNVCSGKSISGQDILSILKRAVNKPDVQFEIDPSLIRPTDAMDIYGDASRLRDELGWQPTYSIDKTIADFVSDAQAKL
jgi:GDP-4-dehydro-6-deoxy-D-mannose reductase